MPARRAILFSLSAGVLHAAGLLLVALDLGYSIGPAAYSPVGLGWRYGGLAVLAVIPVWLAARYRVVGPLVALVLTTGYVLGMELGPPGPTFRDVAALEGLDEPTGIMVVTDGLYVVRYMVDASVWAVGFLFLGVVEYAVRTIWSWPPPVPALSRVSVPASRRRAAIVAAGGGTVHALVMTWFAVRLGVSAAGGLAWPVYVFGTVGMVVLAAVPLYLLVRHRLVMPATLLTAFVLFDARAALTAGVEDPHALYFGGWFVPLGLLLVTAGVEYGVRRLDVTHRFRSSS